MADRTLAAPRPLTADLGRIFLLGSVLGWLGEVALHVFTTGHIVNRGALHGPWMPLYGAGSVVFVLMGRMWLLPPRLPAIFTMGVLAAGILEYSCGALLEGLFHMRWWDYGYKYLAINRRIWFPALMGFSALGTYLALNERRMRDLLAPHWCYHIAALMMACDLAVSLMEPNTGLHISSGL